MPTRAHFYDQDFKEMLFSIWVAGRLDLPGVIYARPTFQVLQRHMVGNVT